MEIFFETLRQISHQVMDGVLSITNTALIGAFDGTCKTEQDGLFDVGKEPVRVTIFNKIYSLICILISLNT